MTIRHRVRVGDDLEINRNEATVAARLWRLGLSGTYTFLEADPENFQTDDREEFSLFGSFDLSPNWKLNGAVRRDLEEGEFIRAGAGIKYANECCEIGLFLSRDFTSTENVAAATTVTLQVQLLTLGTSDTGLFTDTIFDIEEREDFLSPSSGIDR